MASKRKRKKEIKKQQVANGSAKKPSPQTAMAEALDKANKALDAAEKANDEAKEKKAAAKQAQADADEAKAKADKAASDAVAKEKAAQAQAKQEEIREKEKKKEKPKKKYIIGFGTKTQLSDDPDNDGLRIFHAVSNVDNSALCDSRIVSIPIDKEISAKDCNCKACQKYVAFRNLLELEQKHEKQKEDLAKEPKEKPKPKSKPKKKKKADDDSDDLAPIRQMLTTRIRNMEKRLWDRMKEYIDEALDAKPSFYIIQTIGQRYSIVHEKSRLAIVSGMVQKDAEQLLPKFLEIPYKWDGITTMPQEWMRAVKKITEKFTTDLKKPKRKIKRRKDKASKAPKPKLTRKIKRRKVKEKPVRKIKRRSRTR